MPDSRPGASTERRNHRSSACVSDLAPLACAPRQSAYDGRRLTLALRLLLAFGLLAVTATAAVGVGVREAWRQTEEQGFRERLDAATRGVEAEIAWEVQGIRDLLRPVCEHDAFIDQTLVDLERHDLDVGRRLAITQLVPEEMKALNLDELVLVTGSGEVLGAGHDPAAAGTTNRQLASEIVRPAGVTTRLARPGAPPAALVTRCSKTRGGNTIGLVGARHLGPILDRLGRAYDVRLSIADGPAPRPSADEETAVTPALSDLGGLRITAAVSRKPLERKLALLDQRLLLLAGGAFGVAIVLAMVIARSLARPIEALARQARDVVRSEPRPVRATGGRELDELANAFNKALGDLAAMRKRLAVTERIAARREIARQVAHEIKNPLAPIRAAVETLRRLRARDDPAFDEYFDEASRTVLEEVHRIAKIVSEFTEFARLPAPSPAPMSLVDVARSVVALHAAGGGNVVLVAAECPTIRADRDQLVQVLTNLVQNALDAAGAAKGADARVVVRVEAHDDGRVRIVVADNGPGVGEEMLPRLFEPYATNKPHGTGLGLAIVERIVKEHDGEIAYERGADGGAVFRIVLPIEGPVAAPESNPQPHALR